VLKNEAYLMPIELPNKKPNTPGSRALRPALKKATAELHRFPTVCPVLLFWPFRGPGGTTGGDKTIATGFLRREITIFSPLATRFMISAQCAWK
jgi:hypothetical protein